jgi:TnpA family transposase
VLDEVVGLFDQAISAREGKAERKMRDALAERGKSGEDRQALLDDLLDIIFDLGLDDEQIGGLIRGERIGWPRLRSAREQAAPRLPRDHGHLAALDGSYGYLRQFTPQVLAAVRFAGGTAAAGLLEAVEILRELNATGARRVPDEAPDGFVPARWRGYLDTAIVSLLIELDKRTGFLDCFTHAGGKQSRSPELKRNLIAVLISHSTNLGLTRMADACGISYDILAWTAEWYVREETLRAANLAIIGYHGTLPLTPVFGTGTLSSSDGQRFPVRGKTLTGRDMVIHGGQVLSTYTHVTDQHTTYGTKIIVATKREAHYVLDEILGNATDVPVTEHATDTHGVTLVNFGLFDLLGLQLSPRIRDLGKITLYRTGSRAQVEAEFPHTGPLLTRKLNTDLIAEHYDDLLRVAGSLKFGHATASLLVGKLSASGRQNALAAALKEYGALRRTIYAARYLADPAYRRKISRQLNKGESLHALKRDLLYAHEGTVRARHIEAQTEQAWCLTLVTNAVVTWSTEYYGLAVDSMRAAGRRIDDEVLAHISPAHSENINFFGAIEVDIEGELAQLGPTGYRPLRVRDTLF